MKTEIPHTTREQVRDYLRTALELTEELDPPADLRPHAFVAAVDLVAAKQLLFEQAAPLDGRLMLPPRG